MPEPLRALSYPERVARDIRLLSDDESLLEAVWAQGDRLTLFNIICRTFSRNVARRKCMEVKEFLWDNYGLETYINTLAEQDGIIIINLRTKAKGD